MVDVFLYGTLCHPPLLAAVIGRALPLRPARLPGHELRLDPEADHPLIRPCAGGVLRGGLARGLGAEDAARLEFYARAVGWVPGAVEVELEGGEGAEEDAGPPRRRARVFWPAEEGTAEGGPWLPADWAARRGPLAVAAAEEVMRGFGRRSPAEIRARYPQILIRAASRLRAAAEPRPTALRRRAGPGDVLVERLEEPYARFFAVEEAELRFRRFGGGMSERVNRAVFVSGDAVTVLPYDPLRDRVMVVEQFRAGAHGRGDPQPWLLEPIAGRIDPEETPEEAARRESAEEAGIALGRLIEVARCYPSPGGKTEYLFVYLALAELPDAAAGVAGLADEAEDIRAHVIPFARLMELLASGEVDTAPLVISALWLDRLRPALRAEAAAAQEAGAAGEGAAGMDRAAGGAARP